MDLEASYFEKILRELQAIKRDNPGWPSLTQRCLAAFCTSHVLFSHGTSSLATIKNPRTGSIGKQGSPDTIQATRILILCQEPVFVEAPSRQPTPQKKRVAQPDNWVRNNWTCDVKCAQCASDKEALPLLAAALVTCNKSCSFDCARTVCDAARKQARSLRHDAYTQGTALHHFSCDSCSCLLLCAPSQHVYDCYYALTSRMYRWPD